MLTIGQVASRTGLRVSAIRYYESRGLLPRASRVGGRRVYEVSVLERLAIIELAKTAGFNLDEIRSTLAHIAGVAPSVRWKTLTAAKRQAVDAEMKRLRISKLVLTRMSACSCTTLEECGRAFLEALSKYPVESPIELRAKRQLAAKRLQGRSR